MIDVHTHPVQIKELHDADPALERAVRDVFGLYMKPQPLETYFLQLDAAGIDRAVALPLDCSSAHGCSVVSNAQIVRLMESSDRIIGFASVDPSHSEASRTLERDVREHGLRGLKLDPSLQQFDLADRERAYPVYGTCVELDIPVLVHCGLSWAPRGRAALANPLLLEPVVHDFPTLRIIIAHFGWPWVQEALMLALKHPHVYLDTSIVYSGTPSESLTHVLGHAIGLDVLERSLSDQILFASNYPRVDPKRVAEGVRRLGLRPTLEQKVFHTNAARLLKLED